MRQFNAGLQIKTPRLPMSGVLIVAVSLLFSGCQKPASDPSPVTLSVRCRTFHLDGHIQECWPTDDPNMLECLDYTQEGMLRHIAEEWGTRTNMSDFVQLAKHWKPEAPPAQLKLSDFAGEW